MNIFTLRLAVLSLTASLALLLTGCGKAAVAAKPTPPVVTVAAVETREITETEEFTGRTEAIESVDVRPRVSGHIQDVRFQSGQLVKKGDLLFVIDPRWYQAEADRRAADAAQAKAHLDNAERIAKRAERLLSTKAISSEEADTSRSQWDEARAALLAAQSTLETAKLDLLYTEVRAPINGRVSRALLTTGNYVSGAAGAAALLTTIVSVDPIYVYADVDEDTLLRFNALAREQETAGVADTHAPVELALANETGFPHHGRIESFDNRLDANTGTIVMRATFPNPDGRLVPGLFARIQAPTSARGPAVLVDESAIGTDQAQQFVLAIGHDNMAEYRQVKLGPVINGQRVVRSGLKAGEKIVVNGLQRVRAGMPVTPQERAAVTRCAPPRVDF